MISATEQDTVRRATDALRRDLVPRLGERLERYWECRKMFEAVDLKAPKEAGLFGYAVTTHSRAHSGSLRRYREALDDLERDFGRQTARSA